MSKISNKVVGRDTTLWKPSNLNVLVRFADTCAVWIHDPETRAHLISQMKRLSSLSFSDPCASFSSSSSSSVSGNLNDTATDSFVSSQFPGPLPISLHRSHVPVLYSGFKEFVVLPKTDGTRYILLCCIIQSKPRSVIINRKGDMFMVELNLNPSWYQGSLFDGELVERKTKFPSSRYCFYIFDTFTYQNQKTYDEDYVTRMAVASLACSILPCQDKEKDDYKSHILQPFEIKVKAWYPIQDIQNLWNNIVPQMDHYSDGLIFVCISDPLRSRQNVQSPTFLKWKPKREQTVDFLIRVVFSTHTNEISAEEAFQLSPQHSVLNWIEPWNKNSLFQNSVLTLDKNTIVVQLWSQDKIKVVNTTNPSNQDKPEAMKVENGSESNTISVNDSDSMRYHSSNTTDLHSHEQQQIKEVLVPFAVTTIDLNAKELHELFEATPIGIGLQKDNERQSKSQMLDGQIAEFNFNTVSRRWELMKIRMDRDTCNSLYVCRKTKKNIFCGVELEELLL